MGPLFINYNYALLLVVTTDDIMCMLQVLCRFSLRLKTEENTHVEETLVHGTAILCLKQRTSWVIPTDLPGRKDKHSVP